MVLTSTFPRWSGDCEPPFVFELSKRLTAKFDVTVLCPHAHGAALNEIIDGIQVHRFRYCFERWQKLAYEGGIMGNLKRSRLNYLLVPFFLTAQLFSLLRVLRMSQIDVIHAHWLIPQGLVAIVARALSLQKPDIICTSHGGDLFGLSGRLMSWIKRLIILNVDKMIVVSEAMRTYASKLSGRQDIEVISMGVDVLHHFTPSKSVGENCYQLLFVGRLVEKKGVRYLIEAMPEILRHYPQAQLLIAGDGPEKMDLQKLALNIAPESQIQFLGSIDNSELQLLYRQASIFVAPSVVAKGGDQEGLGLVFVEALGCACAVIASDLPAIRDVVIDELTGLVCKQKNSADLAQKVCRLLGDPALRERLGETGRSYVREKYDWSTITRRYTNVIETFI